MTDETHYMKAAKCSQDDIDQIREFMRNIEGLIDAGSNKELVEYLGKNFTSACGRHYERLLFGYETLIDNVCDPTVTYLAWKPELQQLIDQAGLTVKDPEGERFSTKPMMQMEMAARTVFDKFSTEWPKIERDLKGCFLHVDNEPDGKSVKWIVRGMSPEKAEIYNERYAKPFENALVGVLNVQKVTLEFEVKRSMV